MIARIDIQQLPVVAEILSYDAKRTLLRIIECEAARNAAFGTAVQSALARMSDEQAIIDEWLERQEAALFPPEGNSKESDPAYWVGQA